METINHQTDTFRSAEIKPVGFRSPMVTVYQSINLTSEGWQKPEITWATPGGKDETVNDDIAVKNLGEALQAAKLIYRKWMLDVRVPGEISLTAEPYMGRNPYVKRQEAEILLFPCSDGIVRTAKQVSKIIGSKPPWVYIKLKKHGWQRLFEPLTRRAYNAPKTRKITGALGKLSDRGRLREKNLKIGKWEERNL